MTLALTPVGWLTLPACLVAGFEFYALHSVLMTKATQIAPTARGTAMSLFSCSLFTGPSAGVVAVSTVTVLWSNRTVLCVSGLALLCLALAFSAWLNQGVDKSVKSGG